MSYHEAPDSQADGWKDSPTRPEPSVEEMLAQLERLDFLYEAMEKVWLKIQADWRQPWRQ